MGYFISKLGSFRGVIPRSFLPDFCSLLREGRFPCRRPLFPPGRLSGQHNGQVKRDKDHSGSNRFKNKVPSAKYHDISGPTKVQQQCPSKAGANKCNCVFFAILFSFYFFAFLHFFRFFWRPQKNFFLFCIFLQTQDFSTCFLLRFRIFFDFPNNIKIDNSTNKSEMARCGDTGNWKQDQKEQNPNYAHLDFSEGFLLHVRTLKQFQMATMGNEPEESTNGIGGADKLENIVGLFFAFVRRNSISPSFRSSHFA